MAKNYIAHSTAVPGFLLTVRRVAKDRPAARSRCFLLIELPPRISPFLLRGRSAWAGGFRYIEREDDVYSDAALSICIHSDPVEERPGCVVSYQDRAWQSIMKWIYFPLPPPTPLFLFFRFWNIFLFQHKKSNGFHEEKEEQTHLGIAGWCRSACNPEFPLASNKVNIEEEKKDDVSKCL